ncbi:MAG: LacI family DNA-binding transcriptional regulator [Opitutaceae bacterium]|jgi:LacI family transcriptional regulator
MANQRTIAKFLGIHQSTVSLALRGDPSITAGTRSKVAEAARKLGYFPNPYVSTLMAHIQSGKEVRDKGCLALVVDATDEARWLCHPAYRQQYESIRARAALRGFRTECFFLGASGMSARKLDRILHARGIIGVIFAAPMVSPDLTLDMRWERYACVTSGYTWPAPPVDRVSTHHRHHLETAFAELRRRGYKRIGFGLPRMAEQRADSNWLAGWLLCQHRLPARDRIPELAGYPGDVPFFKFRRWHARWKPDALISLNGAEYPWLQKIGLNPGTNFGLVCLFHQPGSDFAAVDENNAVIGEMLCDLVAAHIVHNERGIPAHPRLILVEGTWIEGKTVRPQPIS